MPTKIVEPNKNVIKILEHIISKNKVEPKDLGYTKEEFDSQTIPDEDYPDDEDRDKFVFITPNNTFELAACAKLLGATENTNSCFYNPNSFMKWHTNSINAGKRIYYSYSLGEAIFRYQDENGDIITEYDNVGEWTCREFEVPKEGYLWHTIWVKDGRYAFGFNVKD